MILPALAVCFTETSIYPLGVVIPTYNRIDTLLVCLEHLQGQTWKDFEVIVIDDGSTDSTQQVMEHYQRDSPFPLRYLQQPNYGPARARNQAVNELNSEVCLLLGDDIFASPELLHRHWEHHALHPGLDIAAVGLTRWSLHGQEITPFMEWLDRDGAQFAYGDLLGGVVPSWNHFYTSNLSLKTGQLRRHPFDERFRKAAMEDIELGYRLATANELNISFLPAAIADHLHPTSFRQACHRMIGLGESAYLLGKIWPEHEIKTEDSVKAKMRSVLQHPWILNRLVDLADVWTRFRVPNPLMQRVLSLHSMLGYRRAEEYDSSNC